MGAGAPISPHPARRRRPLLTHARGAHMACFLASQTVIPVLKHTPCGPRPWSPETELSSDGSAPTRLKGNCF